MKRYVYYRAGDVLTTASSGIVEVPTADDQVARTLTGIFVEPTTADVEIQLSGGGFTFAKLDANMCAAGNERVHLSEPFPPTIKFGVNIVNHPSGTYSGKITLEYEPGPGAGGVSGAR